MWDPVGKICAAYTHDQNERPNDRVLINFCHTISMSIFAYSSAYFRLVCSQVFSFFTSVWSP